MSTLGRQGDTVPIPSFFVGRIEERCSVFVVETKPYMRLAVQALDEIK